MVLKLKQGPPSESKHNVCILVSRTPTFAPMESIKERREQVGLTQTELAELCECTNSHMSHIEHFRVTPSLDTFVKMAKALKVSLDRMFELLTQRPKKSAASSVADIQKERDRRRTRHR